MLNMLEANNTFCIGSQATKDFPKCLFGHSPPSGPSGEKLPDSPSEENIYISYPLGLRLDLRPHDLMQRRVHAYLFKAEASREPTGFTRLRTITAGVGIVACDNSAEPGYQQVAIHNT